MSKVDGKTKTSLTEFFDLLEVGLIRSAIPLIQELKELRPDVNFGENNEEIAKNIIMKIGTRMMFGKDKFDEAYTKVKGM